MGYCGVLLVAVGWMRPFPGCAKAAFLRVTPLPKDADPSQEISAVSQLFDHAKSNQVDVYAPDSFAKAETAFNDARKGTGRTARATEVSWIVSPESQAYGLKQAEERRSSKTQGALGEVVSARTRAVDAGASAYRPSSMKECQRFRQS